MTIPDKFQQQFCKNCGDATKFDSRALNDRVRLGWCSACYHQKLINDATPSHITKIARKLAVRETILQQAKETTSDHIDKTNLYLNINEHNKYIPYGEIVLLKSCCTSMACQVDYQGQMFNTKKNYLKKIW